MKINWLCSVSFLATIATTSPAYAQQGVEESNATGDIIVTARRREESISKVPVAITAFSGETLAQKQIVSVMDLTKLTPGLNFGGGGALTNSVVTIRGFSRALVGPGAPGVISYFNDVPLNNSGSNIPTFDMENMQVLKGPQGTLFGRNAIGGAILSYSKKPNYDFDGYVEGEYGTANTMRFEGAINLPVVQDKVALRIAGQLRDSDGFVRGYVFSPPSYQRGPNIPGISAAPGVALNDRPINLDKSSTKAVRASLLIRPFDGLSNLSIVDYTRLSGIGGIDFVSLNPTSLPGLPPAFLPPALGTLLNPVFNCGYAINCDAKLALAHAQAHPRVQYTDTPPYNVSKIFGATNITSVNITDHIELKNIFAFRTTKINNATDLDGTALNILSAATLTNQKQVTNELQVTGSVLNDKLEFVMGGFYYKTSPNGRGGDQAVMLYVLGGLSVPYSINYLTAKSKALYGQIDYDASSIISGLQFTAGYRQTWDDQNACAYGAAYHQFGQIGTNRRTPGPGSRPDFTPTFEQCKTGVFAPDPNAVPGTTAAAIFKENSNKGTYTLAAKWQATDEVLLYATARRGYRAGGINYPKVGPAISDAQNFKPEVLDDIEIGAKSSLDIAGRPLNVSLAAFRGKVKDAQSFVPTEGLKPIYFNGTGMATNRYDYTIKGVEGLIQVELVDGLTLGGNFAYITAKLDKKHILPSLLDAFTDSGILNALNGQFVIFNQPKWQVNGNFEYVARDALGGGDFHLGADVHYQTQYTQNQVSIPAYTTVDGRIGLTGLSNGRVDVTLWAKNILNEYYYHGGSLTTKSVGVLTYLQAPPRTVGATLRYHFGGD